MKNAWIAAVLFAMGSQALAADDVVFATSEDASAFDHALMNRQGKNTAAAKPTANSLDAVDVSKEVIAAKKGVNAPGGVVQAAAAGGSKASGVAGGGVSTIIGAGSIGGAGAMGPTAGAPIPAGAPHPTTTTTIPHH